ncbi:MAG TPA: TerB family tellurite resistance protein [Alphaproteobacteria bacterium]
MTSLSPPAPAPQCNVLGQWADRIRSWLAGHSAAPPLDRAVAALLVHAATLSGPMEATRRRCIGDMLDDCAGRAPEGVAALIDWAEREDRRAVDVHRFIRVINRGLPQRERAAVFTMVAKVVFAGRAGDDEKGLLRLLGGLLGISDHDRAVIQHYVQAGAVASTGIGLKLNH